MPNAYKMPVASSLINLCFLIAQNALCKLGKYMQFKTSAKFKISAALSNIGSIMPHLLHKTYFSFFDFKFILKALLPIYISYTLKEHQVLNVIDSRQMESFHMSIISELDYLKV